MEEIYQIARKIAGIAGIAEIGKANPKPLKHRGKEEAEGMESPEWNNLTTEARRHGENKRQ